jgi:hypothetical protein
MIAYLFFTEVGELLQAYILINTEPAKLWEVADKCEKNLGHQNGTCGNAAI